MALQFQQDEINRILEWLKRHPDLLSDEEWEVIQDRVRSRLAPSPPQQKPASKVIQTFLMRCKPYHSASGDVHHVYKDCTLGNNIEVDNLLAGTGDKPLCRECANR